MQTQATVHSFPLELPEGLSLPQPPLASGDLLSADGREARVLLHCCCAPCSTAILEWMVCAGLRPGIFFSNANIYPFEEYVRRRQELVRYAASCGLEVVEDEYDHAAWLAHVRQLESPAAVPASIVSQHGTDEQIRIADMPERGSRCQECFKFRLLRAARYASDHGYGVLTTTLASSRWKNLQQVDIAGRFACAAVNAENAASPSFTEVAWWGQNWRKGGLQDRRNCLIHERALYNQDYCGCEFSVRPVHPATSPELI